MLIEVTHAIPEKWPMQFQIIDSDHATVRSFRAEQLNTAMVAIGLNPGQVDFGTVCEGVSIVVYEFGMYQPKEECRYFSVGRQLFVGNAVLFAFNNVGETVDLPRPPPVIFYRDFLAVEQAIGWGQIERPQIALNGQVMWKWPERRVP